MSVAKCAFGIVTQIYSLMGTLAKLYKVLWCDKVLWCTIFTADALYFYRIVLSATFVQNSVTSVL